MRRALVVFLVTAAAVVSVAPATAAGHTRRGFLFSLHDAGFWIQGRSELGSGRMRLLLDRHGEVAYYYVKARVGAGTVRARFGRLGSLDLRFVPKRGEGAVGCGGGEGWLAGAFVGRVVFRGEHDYAHVDARRAHGWFQTYPPGGCGRGGRADESERARAGASGPAGGGAAAATPSRTAPVAETGAQIQGETGSRPPNRWIYFFTDNGQKGTRVIFEALRVERRERMRIERGAQVYGGAAGFVWNLAAGTARVEPPAPFSGRAFYRAGAEGRPPSWTGSLTAPILGGPPMSLTGPQLNARLLPGSPLA